MGGSICAWRWMVPNWASPHSQRAGGGWTGRRDNSVQLRDQLADKVVLYFAEQEAGAHQRSRSREGTSLYLLQQELSSVERATFPNGDAEDVRISGIFARSVGWFVSYGELIVKSAMKGRWSEATSAVGVRTRWDLMSPRGELRSSNGRA